MRRHAHMSSYGMPENPTPEQVRARQAVLEDMGIKPAAKVTRWTRFIWWLQSIVVWLYVRFTRVRIRIFGEDEIEWMSTKDIENLRKVNMVDRDRDRFANMTPAEFQRMMKAAAKHRWLKGFFGVQGTIEDATEKQPGNNYTDWKPL